MCALPTALASANGHALAGPLRKVSRMPVIPEKAKGRAKEPSLRELEFLPDPDAIEQRPLGGVTRGVLVLLSTLIAVTLTWAGFFKARRNRSCSGSPG